MQLYQQQSGGLHTDLQNLRKRAAERVDGLRNQHLDLVKDLERAVVRLERLERDMEQLEMQTSPRACVHAVDKVLEQEVWIREEEEKEEGWEEGWEEVYSTVSGEQEENRRTKEMCVCVCVFHSGCTSGCEGDSRVALLRLWLRPQSESNNAVFVSQIPLRQFSRRRRVYRKMMHEGGCVNSHL